jgi:hypothetical protein
MFSDFFAFKKKTKEEIPDISTEELVIIEGIQPEIRNLLQEAQLYEKKQLKEKDVQSRRDYCESALLKYQKALDSVNANSKKYKDFPRQQDVYIGQSLRIKNRMEYLEGIIGGLKSKKRREAA